MRNLYPSTMGSAAEPRAGSGPGPGGADARGSTVGGAQAPASSAPRFPSGLCRGHSGWKGSGVGLEVALK